MNKIFATLDELAAHMRQELDSKSKRHLLLFAYNSIGKTRLSMAFREAGKQGEERDTLYFNAFTEDLFTWDNDLEHDNERVLKINSSSRFFSGLEELELESRIRRFLHRYVDFDFKIDYEKWAINFSRGTTVNNIKISRGEESIFVWCFFLAIFQLAIDEEETYKWVKYVYIDDPVSSLDENNCIAMASHLAELLKKQNNIKIVISSHHTLFFNVLFNEFKSKKSNDPTSKYFLHRDKQSDKYILKKTNDTPFFHHIATLVELRELERNDKLRTHHFNMLRIILEKSASFHGFKNFSDIITNENSTLHARVVNLLNHGNYSLYEPREMLEENKTHFRRILDDFLNRYPFNSDIFSEFSVQLDSPEAQIGDH